MQIGLLANFNTWQQQRNTRTWTGKNQKGPGIEKSEGIQKQVKEKLEKTYSTRLRMILKSDLKAKKKYSNWSISYPCIKMQFWYT